MPAKAAAKPVKPATKAAPKPANKAPAPKAAAAKPVAKAAPKAAAPAVRPASGSSNGVYVKNWGTGSVADATNVFSAAGKVVKVQLRRQRYALVFFENSAAVKKAIDLFNEKEVLGQTVLVVPAKASPKPDAHENSSCVFVSPIFRPSTTKAQVMELFAGVKVQRLRMYRQNFAYAYLDSPAAAKKFVEEKNGTAFRGHTLRVALSARSLEKLRARQEVANVVIAAHRHYKVHERQ
ncbi:RNA binding protein / NRBD1 [Leishmania donovani]|uniref:RNA_binding_protein_-_putative n=3 Tax=Leishmania donovani species complex TaxID=38574 RepID=A0A6L0XRM4_LEIIN|nr:putative RNA binding protein [Leishmania infantum JPCM5]XP_003863497.1 RNA binding protein, putative [Leishmania donovani]5OSG_h Chain h, RNA binding protein, putative [Leishmania donovani]CAC9523673.1 RNA_binding_protein_-_putative [Leishmania infantum]AYU81626.1 RNA binding protein, putative [Leishmania donovani]TPP43594.1 RNA recognition motif family protein [Leishmania donovani]TPP47089.1 RNA recognition motif family protein [Leishmania donovani]CAJ1991611.1 RNA binding protein / NRBD|eukprot:XP_001467761.1 putative RNA binding protein [Leishmania infantum JPCM5]